MLSASVIGLWVLTALILLVLRVRLRLQTSQLPLPPGPKGLPVVGNLLQIPSENVWKFYGTDMVQKYGDITHFSVFRTHIIVLNSYAAAYDLLSLRSTIYSDRPRLPMTGELVGGDQTTPFMHYGSDWRSHRRVWQQHLNPRAVGDYSEHISLEAQAFVKRLLGDSKNIHSQNKLHSIKTIVTVAFGKKVESLDDPFVTFTESVGKSLTDAMMPGNYLVDTFPFMLKIPAWFPGASWKRFGLQLRERVNRLGTEPYEFVETAMATGKAPKSFTSQMIQNPCASEVIQKRVAGMVYFGAVDTTHESFSRFIVAMMENPEVQRRAQQEIDSLTGQSRLPGIQDKGSLPYIDAIIQEVLRWNLIGPLAVPHASIQDDEYKGYRIPKGSIVFQNLWVISQDPVQYPSPERFSPERYLVKAGQDKPLDPRLYTFGIGRRVCPGRHFAELTLYTTIVTLLATVSILKPLDEDGKEYMSKIEFEGSAAR